MDLLTLQKEYNEALANEQAFNHKASLLSQIRKDCEEALEKAKLLSEGLKPFLIGQETFSDGDMMGKNRDTYYSSRIIWSSPPPLNHKDAWGRHRSKGIQYCYAFELDPSCILLEKTRYGFYNAFKNNLVIKNIAYINNDNRISLKTKKMIINLPIDWNDQIQKFINKWKKEIQDLRDVLE